jgi:hypothetical protein
MVFGYPGNFYRGIDTSKGIYEVFQCGVEKEDGLIKINEKKENI